LKESEEAMQIRSSRRAFLRAMGMGLTALAMTGCGPFTRSRKRPNILFLFTDDQRFNAVHALGNPEVKTPNIDRLVRQGTAFTHAHIMGSMSGAVCMPSRAMLLSGRTLFHLHRDGRDIPSEHITLPELFRQNGYVTFGTGKWHNGRAAFARSFSTGGKIFFGGMSNHLKVPVYDFDPSGEYPHEKQYIGEKFSSELFSDAVIDFLENDSGDAPFFAYVSYTAPHDPRMAPPEYAKMYPPDRVTLPENFMPRHPFDNGEMKIRDEKLAPWPRTPEVIRQHIAAYYAMITHLDDQIGRVLQALEKSGKAENTIVIFASDNGLAVGQHGLMGKQNLYDHSIRVPLVFSGPGIPVGEKRDALCYLLDIYPTLCDMVGLKTPGSVEGMSLMPIISHQKDQIRDSLFFAYKHFQRGVRKDGWKLIKYNVKGQQTTQLFHVQNDPWELHNLANEPAYSGQLQSMTSLLEQWMHNIDDPLDLQKPDWGYSPVKG